MKVNYSVIQVQKNDNISLHDVVSATLSNYSPNVVYFTIDGVRRPLPAFDNVSKLPAPFQLEICGYEFDLKVKFDFDGNAGNVIIDYGTPKQC